MSRRERHRRRQRHRGSPIKRVLLFSTIVSVCGVALGALALVGWVVGVADSAPNLDQLKPHKHGGLSEVFAANGQSLGWIQSDVLSTPVKASQIPKRLRRATVAIEDRRFYQHGALDYQGIVRAAIRDIFNGGSTLQGASTLTMQLVDNLYPQIKTHRTLHYKIVQAKLAEQMLKEHTRRWVLTNYLEDVPYGTVNGQTAYGVGAASQMFFDKPVSRIDLVQAALLAGLPQAPSEYNPFEDPKLARTRRNQVLQSMVAAGYISQQRATNLEGKSLQVQRNSTYSGRKQPYVFDYVQQQLIQHFCPNTPGDCPRVTNGGLKIYTTIDLQKEALAKQALLNHEGAPGQPAAALVSIDPHNGHIVAMATTSDYDQTSFDYATQAERQTGSAFKVFALMTLIHDYNGDPNTTYYNSHLLAPGWLPGYPTYSVHTAELSYQGDISITKATWDSDNTVFAQLAQDETMAKVSATAHAMGITSKLDNYPSEVLGAVSVSPLQMADAYATLASGGVHHSPSAISKVVFPDGSTVSLGDTTGNRVFPYGQAYAADEVLKGVITEPGATGTAANYGCPAAGKTGTTSNYTDAYFVGYTPQYSTAVWVGYPNSTESMADGFGGTLAAPIWHDYMEQASNGYCSDFTVPTDPWHGTPFFGPFATTGSSRVGTSVPSATTGGTTVAPPTTTVGPTTPTTPATTPAPPAVTPAPPSGGGTAHPPPGFGNGHLHGGGPGAKTH
jgi:penicillin-binding protein 1A